MPPWTGSPPASATSPASATADASRTWPGRSAAVSGGTTSSPVDSTVTRGLRCTVTSVTPAAASMPRSWARSGRPGRGQFGAGGGVLVGPHHPVARRHRPDHLDRARHGLGGVLDHHDGVRARGQHATGGHAGRRAGADRDVRLGPHQHGPGDLQVAGQPVGHAVRVGRPHRVTVHGRAREAGQRVRRGDRLGRHPVQGRRERNRFGRACAVPGGTRPAPRRPCGW